MFNRFLLLSNYYSHGTNCAGIIAGGDNNNCGVGIAYDAQIASKNIKYLIKFINNS